MRERPDALPESQPHDDARPGDGCRPSVVGGVGGRIDVAPDVTTNPTASTTPETRAFEAPLGGIMTREVGTITGEVEIWVDEAAPDMLRIRYVGALDVYTVNGKLAGRSLEEAEAVLTADPGVDEFDNPRSTDLTV